MVTMTMLINMGDDNDDNSEHLTGQRGPSPTSRHPAKDRPSRGRDHCWGDHLSKRSLYGCSMTNETTVEIVIDQRDHCSALWRWSSIKEKEIWSKKSMLGRFNVLHNPKISVKIFLSIRMTTQNEELFRTNSIFCSRVFRSLLDSATSGGFHISATRMEEVRRMTQFRKSWSRPSHGSYLTPMYEVL